MVVRGDYTQEQVEAAHSVLLELTRLLGEYRNEIVLVGGWVPALLLPEGVDKHIGSIDVDLAFKHRTLQEPGYQMIRKLLQSRGYVEGKQPFIFHRKVKVGNRTVEVEVDLLAGEYEGTGKSHRTQRVQDVRARKARGCELALEMATEVHVDGTLPGGGKDSAKIRVASIVPFIVMKGMALYDRVKEKDAWDIFFCVKNYPGGPEALVEEFRPHISHGLVKEGLQKIGEKFVSPDHTGPMFVADFEEITDTEERELLQRDAFEQINYLREELGFR
jgi:hypothetical protein